MGTPTGFKEEAEKAFGKRVLPIALTDDGFQLLLVETGEVYGLAESAIFLVGTDMDDALNGLAAGRKSSFLTDNFPKHWPNSKK